MSTDRVQNRSPEAEPSRPTLRRRWASLGATARAVVAWVPTHRLWTGLLIAGCLLSVAGVVFGWLAIMRHQPPVTVTLDMALSALDEGARARARELAEKLQQQGTLRPEELGGPVFVLGAAAAHEADEAWGKDKTRQCLLAARYLEEARDRGFLPGREGEGLYLLGRSLYLSGQIPASRPILSAALKAHPAKQSEIHRLLGEAYLNDARPQLEKALAANGRYLADGRLSAAARQEGLLQQAQILLRLGQRGGCLAALDQIPPDSASRAEATILRAQVLIEEARTLRQKPEPSPADQRQIGEKYQAAIQALRQAQGRDTLSAQATRKAMYLIGMCFLELGDKRAALDQFARTCRLYAETAEGLAASFQEAELCRQSGRDEDALAAYRRTLDGMTDPINYSNPWISLDALRAGMLAAYQQYLKAGKFQLGLQLAAGFSPLWPRPRALELTAEAHRSWGESLLAQAAGLPPDKAEANRRAGRAQWRKAGQVYQRLAELQVATRQYPDHLWQSANAYAEGHDYAHAARRLREYLKNESRERHPQALLLLGEARLALGEIDRALGHFRECIETHPRDAAAFHSRLLASQAYTEKGDLDQAEALLRENLDSEQLTPEGREWRDSLFALGRLLHTAGRWQEAIERLEEAVARYPDDPQLLAARYLVADSHRQIAQTIRGKSDQDEGSLTRAAQARQIERHRREALDRYQQLRELLSGRHDASALTAVEQSMLRNCCFAVAGILFDLEEYEAAIKAYAAITQRFPKCPEVLEAYVQMAAAYRGLNKPAEARGALEQAKATLARMKNDSQFPETTNLDRRQWSELLDTLAGL